jgi:hypothetical protein
LGFAVANLGVAGFLLVGIFRFLPTRWWVVDGGGVVAAAVLGGSGIALLARAKIAERLTRIAASFVLVMGLALVTALVATAGWLSGVYGQVGTTGAIIFGLVVALLVPYVVVLPIAELAWLRVRK